METSKGGKRSKMSGILTVFVDDAQTQLKGDLLSGKVAKVEIITR